MDREEIIEASRCSACEMKCTSCRSCTTNRAEAVDCYGGSESVKCPFELGAEWMQEQKQADIRHLEALVETQKAVIRYKEDQLSELTEQLDALHIFCEGVKEHYIDKACKEFCHNCTHEENCEGHCCRYKNFFEAMKGE